MSRRKVRFFFCLLLLGMLIFEGRGKRLVIAATPLVLDQPAPPATRSYAVPEAPPLVDWPTPERLLYRYGAAVPKDQPRAYYDPAFDLAMLRLRPTILASASRHNRPAVTGMSDEDFAVVLAAQLYFEYNSALATRGDLMRSVTPIYQEAQNVANQLGVGDFSVWPANIRPSVALSLLRGDMPFINRLDEPDYRRYPLEIAGSALQTEMRERRLERWEPSASAVAAEIARPGLAVEYMAANFEIASRRAEFDWTPVTWMTLSAWHNQGIVDPAGIAQHPQLARTLPGVAVYLPGALALIYAPPQPLPALVRAPLAR
ncbi:MAG TPA: hypothetical protein VGE07_12385 [Herpetosiphonaceae bacterium]